MSTHYGITVSKKSIGIKIIGTDSENDRVEVMTEHHGRAMVQSSLSGSTDFEWVPGWSDADESEKAYAVYEMVHWLYLTAGRNDHF